MPCIKTSLKEYRLKIQVPSDWRQVLDRQGFGILRIERNFANATLHAAGVVGHQPLPLQIHRLGGALHDGAVVLLAQLRLEAASTGAYAVFGEFQCFGIPTHGAGHGLHELALVLALLLPQGLFRLVLGFEDARLLVLRPLELGVLGLGFRLLLVLGTPCEPREGAKNSICRLPHLPRRGRIHPIAAQSEPFLRAGPIWVQSDPAGCVGW